MMPGLGVRPIGKPLSAGQVRYRDGIAPPFLKTLSDITNGNSVSFDRWLTVAERADARAQGFQYDLYQKFNEATAAFTSGGGLYIQRGGYLTNGEIAVANHNLTLGGANVRATLIKQANLSSKVFNVTGASAVFTDLTVTYNGTPVAGATAYHLASQNTYMDRVMVLTSYIACQMGTGAYGSCGAARISNFQFLEHVYAGAFAWGGVDCFVHHGVIQAVQPGYASNGNVRLLDGTEAFHMEVVDVLQGVYAIVTGATSYASSLRPAYSGFSKVYFDSSEQGTFLDKLVETDFQNCWFSNGRSGAGFPGCTLYQSSQVQFLGCTFANSGGGGLSIQNTADSWTVDTCTFDGNSFTAGNNVADAIVVAANTANGKITNNFAKNALFPGLQRYGLTLGAGISNITVKDNNFTGNATGTINASTFGAGNIIKDNTGFNPIGLAVPAIGASPYTYTNGPWPSTAYITGGTVSVITVGGAGVFISTEKTVELGPNETLGITYTVAPTLRVMSH